MMAMIIMAVALCLAPPVMALRKLTEASEDSASAATQYGSLGWCKPLAMRHSCLLASVPVFSKDCASTVGRNVSSQLESTPNCRLEELSRNNMMRLLNDSTVGSLIITVNAG